MFPLLLINQLSVILTLSTTFGILVHDTKFDQFTTALLAMPAVVASYEGAHSAIKMSDPHTHVERVSISQFGHSMAFDNPRVQPRNDNKKYRLEKQVVKGHHPFDNYNLPVIA
jgi:hypothetical protein